MNKYLSSILLVALAATTGCKSTNSKNAGLASAGRKDSTEMMRDIVAKNPIIGDCSLEMKSTNSSIIVRAAYNGKPDRNELAIKLIVLANNTTVTESDADNEHIIEVSAYSNDGDKNLGFGNQIWSSAKFFFDSESKKLTNLHLKRQQKGALIWSTKLEEDCVQPK